MSRGRLSELQESERIARKARMFLAFGETMGERIDRELETLERRIRSEHADDEPTQNALTRAAHELHRIKRPHFSALAEELLSKRDETFMSGALDAVLQPLIALYETVVTVMVEGARVRAQLDALGDSLERAQGSMTAAMYGELTRILAGEIGKLEAQLEEIEGLRAPYAELHEALKSAPDGTTLIGELEFQLQLIHTRTMELDALEIPDDLHERIAADVTTLRDARTSTRQEVEATMQDITATRAAVYDVLVGINRRKVNVNSVLHAARTLFTYFQEAEAKTSEDNASDVDVDTARERVASWRALHLRTSKRVEHDRTELQGMLREIIDDELERARAVARSSAPPPPQLAPVPAKASTTPPPPRKPKTHDEYVLTALCLLLAFHKSVGQGKTMKSLERAGVETGLLTEEELTAFRAALEAEMARPVKRLERGTVGPGSDPVGNGRRTRAWVETVRPTRSGETQAYPFLRRYITEERQRAIDVIAAAQAEKAKRMRDRRAKRSP